MAAYFQLFKKRTDVPVKFSQIDDEICAFLEVPVDQDKYVGCWYDTIGFMIAIGNPLGSTELRTKLAEFASPLTMRILGWLEENYASDAWTQRGR